MRLPRRVSKYLWLLLLTVACIEPYEFTIVDNTSTLVIEAFVSDKSYHETVAFPSNGRYFTVKLSRTSDVNNTRPTPVEGALVMLHDDAGNQWTYEALPQSAVGLYTLTDPDFRAEPGLKYRIEVVFDEQIYESAWEQMPDVAPGPIGEISFRETERKGYVIVASEPQLQTIKEVTTYISVPQNTDGDQIFYRWKFEPTWVYKPPLSPGNTAPGHICWATDPYYLEKYTLQTDIAGGYDKELFSIPTVRNARIFEDMSILVIQHAVTKEVYEFWREMQTLNSSSIVDQPPFNLKTNFVHVNGDERVSGYFSVVREQATRWYFNKSDLSYNVENTLREDCLKDYGPPLPGCPIPTPAVACECKYCLDYSFGIPTDIKPAWWRVE